MANFKTAQITSREASPMTLLTNPYSNNPLLQLAQVLFTTVTGMVTSDTIELIRFPSATKIISICIANQALAATTFTLDVGIGIPKGPALGFGAPTAVSSNGLVSAYPGQTAVAYPEFAMTTAAANHGLALWQVGGVAADPQIEYVVYATATTITALTVGNSIVFQFWFETP